MIKEQFLQISFYTFSGSFLNSLHTSNILFEKTNFFGDPKFCLHKSSHKRSVLESGVVLIFRTILVEHP